MGDSTLLEHAVIMFKCLGKTKLCHVACFGTRTCLILYGILMLICAIKLLFKRIIDNGSLNTSQHLCGGPADSRSSD